MIRRTVLALALLVALPAAAQIYGWKDKDGSTHYSDQPPPPGAVKILQAPRERRAPAPAVSPEAVSSEAANPEAAGTEAPPAAAEPAPAADAAKPKTLAERELEFRQRRAAEAEAQAKADEEAAREAERRQFCEQARNQLAALAAGQRVSRFNAAGEREYLDDAARAQESARLQRQIDEHCR